MLKHSNWRFISLIFDQSTSRCMSGSWIRCACNLYSLLLLLLQSTLVVAAPRVVYSLLSTLPHHFFRHSAHLGIHKRITLANFTMLRLHKPRISPLETFLNRASRPIPSNRQPSHQSSTPNNNTAMTLLNCLPLNDVRHLRLVSKAIQDWTNARLDDLFSTLYYTITITDESSGTLVLTPTAHAPLRMIGRSCTHFVITIRSPPPTSTPISTPTPQSQPSSTSTSAKPKPTTPPHFLTHLLTHLRTHLLPVLRTLTFSLPDPSAWRTAPTTHSTLVYIRQALESLPPTTTLKTLNLNPISLIHLVSLRWRGLSVYGGEAGWTADRFWKGVRALDVKVFVPMEVCRAREEAKRKQRTQLCERGMCGWGSRCCMIGWRGSGRG